jgi:hypothetical protein
MTTPPLADVPILSADQLTAHWEVVLDPPIFGSHALWLMWLRDDDLPLKALVPLDDLPPLPDDGLLLGLLSLHEAMAAEHLDGRGHLAMALCRQGRPEITEDDDTWVGLLSEVFDDRIEGSWSLHLAAGGRVVPLIDLPPA